jgi:hypothetical protein
MVRTINSFPALASIPATEASYSGWHWEAANRRIGRISILCLLDGRVVKIKLVQHFVSTMRSFDSVVVHVALS